VASHFFSSFLLSLSLPFINIFLCHQKKKKKNPLLLCIYIRWLKGWQILIRVHDRFYGIGDLITNLTCLCVTPFWLTQKGSPKILAFCHCYLISSAS
jgi:hypothetical protein